jgi:hypothetical protein
MPTKIYESCYVTLLDGQEVYVTPLKIKYLREFLDLFSFVNKSKNDDETIEILSKCTGIAMKQYKPEIADRIEDYVDLPTIYKIIEFAAGIKINSKSSEPVKKQAEESGASWEDIDLVKLEAEVFLLGIWKNYEELETSISMAELMITLNSRRDLDYQEKKFLAAMQGVDLDKESGKSNANAWEEMKARVFSKGKTSDPKDIVALQGQNAVNAGFGIGMGLSYEKID